MWGKNEKLIEKAAYDVTENEVLFKSGTSFIIEKIKYVYDDRLFKEFTEIILREK